MSLTRVGLSIVAVMVAIVGAYAVFQAFDSRSAPPIVIDDAAATRPIVVDVRGAVVVPGVFELPPGARVKDAVTAAGGLSATADLSTINLARRLRDGEIVVILAQPSFGSSPVPSNVVDQGGDRAAHPTARINLNTATPDEIELLPEIGEVTARHIVEFREQNGPFRSVDDLIHVDGLSSRTIEEIRDLVTTGP